MQVQLEVLKVLEQSICNGAQLTLPEQLDRKLYVATNKVIEAAGGAWKRAAKAHVFPGDASDRIEQILLTGSIDLPKDEFEFFPTPPHIVSLVHEAANIEDGMTVLEPSAGQGNLLARLEGRGLQVDVIEKMPANAQHLRELGWLRSVQETDFLLVQPEPKYDLVLMNPPFAKQADVRHVLHASNFLKDEGRLVAIMSSGVEFRSTRLTEEFRDLVAERGGEIQRLPEGSFKSSGTSVNTVLVTIPGVGA